MKDPLILKDAKSLRVKHKTDVVVAGGGPAGFAAAVASARQGVNTILVERYGMLGGMATGGLLTEMVETHRYGFGICEELINRLERMKAARPGPTSLESKEKNQWIKGAALSGEAVVWYDPEGLKLAMEEMVVESGVEILYYTLVTNVIMERNSVSGVVVENKEGRQAILGRAVIDATGDADIAAMCKTPCDTHRHPWGIDLGFRVGDVDLVRFEKWKADNHKEFCNHLKIIREEIGNFKWDRTKRNDIMSGDGARNVEVDGLNVWDQTIVTIKTRKKIHQLIDYLKNEIPGFENAYLVDTASQLGIRETRKIVGEYVLTREDVLQRRKFQDVCIHGQFDIPYRCLIPVGVDNLLVCGRCVSVEHEAQGNVRNIPVCLATGQVAGIAAALSSIEKLAPRQLDTKDLQQTLIKGGIYLGDDFRLKELDIEPAKSL